MSSAPQLFCAVRKQWVAALPEEMVRQRILKHMIEDKGYPLSLIAVEQSLRLLPHLSQEIRRSVPNRRADIVCFVPAASTLHPLLIIECKAIKLSASVINQIVGYNHFVRSHFIAIANQEEIRTGWYHAGNQEYAFSPFLPTYAEMCSAVTLHRT